MYRQYLKVLAEGPTRILEMDLTFEGGDARKKCMKVSEHDKFIPAKSFSRSHLPELPQRGTVFNLVKHQIGLTVAIKAQGVSNNRPDMYPGTDFDYPGYKLKGKSVSRNGSGFVCKVVRHHAVVLLPEVKSVNINQSNGNISNRNPLNKTQPNVKRTNKSNTNQTPIQYCRCEECIISDNPRSEWGEINIFTNVHVVYDASEAEHTTCRFFYDTEDSQKIELKAEKIVRFNVKKDWCRLNCLTHDTALLKKLQETLDKFNHCCEVVWNSHQNEDIPSNFVAIVSHPHGKAKQVSVGRWHDKNRDGKYGNHEYVYDAATCAGSSGAYVYIYGGGIYSFDYLHKGYASDVRLGFSTRGWESL